MSEIEQYIEAIKAGGKNDNAQVIQGNLSLWAMFDWQAHPALTAAKRVIVEWSRSEAETGGGLILAGNCGCGKSHIARAIADARGPLARFVNEIDLAKRVQATYNGDGTEKAVLLPNQQTGLLIYDDLGTYTGNVEWMRKIWYSLFNGRHEAGKATIITTNIPLEDHAGGSPLEELLGARLFSRLMGQVGKLRYYIDLFEVPDYRVKDI